MFILNIIPILLLIVTTNAIGLPDDIAYNRSRLERATDEEFSTAIKQMEMISRVTNGIALQQGLSKGSITNEELISELLNLRDVEPSDIMHLDTEEFKKLVEGIHKLSEIIPTTKSSDPIKIRLDTLNSFVNKPIDVEKVEEPGPEFLKAVTTLKKSTLDWKQIEGFAGRLKDFHGKATIVANFPKIGNKIPADTVDDFLHAIGKVMRQIDLSPFKAELAGDSISKAKEKLKDFPKVVKTVNDFANVEKELSYKSKTDDPIIKSLEKSMNVLATVLEQMWNDHEIIRILEKLYILRRHRSGNQDSKLIPAFSRDTSELGLISNDLKDSWVQAEVNGQASILEKAFQPFSALKEKTEKVDGSIGTSTDASFTEINLVLSQIEYLSQFSQISGLSSETLVKVLKSSDEAKKYLPSNRKTIETLYQNMIQLSKHVTSIKEVFKIWEKLVKPKNKLTELKTLATLTDDSKAVEVLKKMQQNANFKDALKTVEDAIEHIKIAELDFKKTVESVVSDYNKMAPFVKQANEFLKTIEPMRQLSKLSNPTSVFKNIETIKDAITNKEFGEKVNIDPVIVSIENTKSALKELDDSINSIKSAKGSEIERLVGATDASETARNIGSATKAVSSMNQFFYLDTSKLKAEIEKLRQGLSVQASIEKKNTVKALASLEIQIQNFKHEIEGFKGSVQPITSSKLSDYSEIFEKAKSVKGITRDFFALSVLVGELKEAYPAPGDKQIIDEIKDLLVTMDKLCLKYSKYQTVFDGSKNTLNNIDLLFTNLKVSNVAPPAKQTKTTPQIPVFKYDDIPTGKKVKNVILMSEFIRNWIIGGSIVYAVAMTLYLCYTYKFNPFQRKNKKGRESDEKKVEEAREKNMKKADEVQGTTITPAPLSAGKTPAATITPTPLSASKTATPTPKKT